MNHPTAPTPTARLEYLRGELRAERVSLNELCELHDLAPHIAADDMELREAAGLPEFAVEETARTEAIATADAHLSNVGLPTYSETLEALRRLTAYCDTYMPSSRRLGVPIVLASGLTNRHDETMSRD